MSNCRKGKRISRSALWISVGETSERRPDEVALHKALHERSPPDPMIIHRSRFGVGESFQLVDRGA